LFGYSTLKLSVKSILLQSFKAWYLNFPRKVKSQFGLNVEQGNFSSTQTNSLCYRWCNKSSWNPVEMLLLMTKIWNIKLTFKIYSYKLCIKPFDWHLSY
jgi:hypothetical protein